MKIIKRGLCPDGTKIQIEDWSQDYGTCFHYNSTIGCYPISKANADNIMQWPERGKIFRCSLDFKNEIECSEAFKALTEGEKTLKDFSSYLWDQNINIVFIREAINEAYS